MAKITRVYREKGVGGFLVEVDNGGSGVLRFHFEEHMLHNDNFKKEIETHLMQQKLQEQLVNSYKQPGAADPVELANSRLQNATLEDVPFTEARPVGDLKPAKKPGEQ